MTTIKTNPHRAVDYSESGIKKALEAAGSLEAEVKYDGVRLNLMVLREGETYWLSRESKPLPALEWMNSELGNAWTQAEWRWFLRQAGYEGIGLMIDGEVMIKGVDFNTSSGIIRTKWLKPNNEEFAEYYPTGTGKKLPFWGARSRLQVVVYGVIDMTIIADPKAEGPIHSVTRLKAEAIVPLLQKYFPEIDWVLSESHTVYDLESLNSLYEEKRLEGHEGLVVKDPLGKYKRGKKSGMWKMKPEDTIDGIVVGLNWGTEGLANEGKVIGFDVLLENGMVVAANNISQAMMDEFTEAVRHAESIGMGMPYTNFQCEVSYMEMTPDGSLRHPSFKCWRGTEDNPTIKS
ncbi:ATP-dependent DNA ligase [Escherichia phage pO91]|uniref:DNA ligase n=1 Tax=Escherichia phage pO91 TaxID=3072194 RepID=A0AA51N3V4_9CAUD|nr:ATP-dependent DNA ligase [Escherichia phage pO91]